MRVFDGEAKRDGEEREMASDESETAGRAREVISATERGRRSVMRMWYGTAVQPCVRTLAQHKVDAEPEECLGARSQRRWGLGAVLLQTEGGCGRCSWGISVFQIQPGKVELNRLFPSSLSPHRGFDGQTLKNRKAVLRAFAVRWAVHTQMRSVKFG